MTTRRQRNKKRPRQHSSENGPASRSPVPRGVELVDEEVLESGLLGLRKDDVKEVGLACTECEYRTVRKGSSAKQALRAHIKRHVRDRRARTRPVAAVLVVLMAAVTLAMAPALVDRVPTLQLGSPGWQESPASRMAEYSFVILCVTVSLTVVRSSSGFITTGKSKWSRRHSLSSRLSFVILLSAAGSRWLLAEPAFSWPWLVAALLPWAAAAATISSVSMTRLAVRRREFSPSNRLKLFRSRDSMADSSIRSGVRDLRHAIQDGRFRLDWLSYREFKMIGRLGLGDELPDPQIVEARLEARERRRQSRFARQESARRGRRRDRY